MLRKSICASMLLGMTAGAALLVSAPASASKAVIAKTDAEIAAAMANPHVQMVRNVSYRELKPGMAILASDGSTLGTVQKVLGTTIIITDGRKTYRVPVEDLYGYTNSSGSYFASRLPKRKLKVEKHSTH